MTVLTPHWVRRLDDGRIEHFFPDKDDSGMYEVFDPASSSAAFGTDPALFTRSIGVALDLVRRHGFSIRMTGNVTGEHRLTPADRIECLA